MFSDGPGFIPLSRCAWPYRSMMNFVPSLRYSTNSATLIPLHSSFATLPSPCGTYRWKLAPGRLNLPLLCFLVIHR